MPFLAVTTPIGPVTVFADDGAIVAIDWGWPPDGSATDDALLNRACDQIEAYFNGELRQFDLPLNPQGTAFQRKVWSAIAAIPFGQTRSYGELAHDLDSGPRAIGTACGRNPIPIVIPCHRVLGANGALGGYSGHDGIDTKRDLLRLEGSWPALSP